MNNERYTETYLMGKKDGVELHIDHIKPKDFGGEATIENGQTLCAQHNFIKKNLKQMGFVDIENEEKRTLQRENLLGKEINKKFQKPTAESQLQWHHILSLHLR